MEAEPSYTSALPVLCIGNLTAGGAGKTPTAMEFARVAKAMKLKPGFLTRGYGSAVRRGPLKVNFRSHNSHDVGDEALLLAARAPTVVCADRVAGVKMLEEMGVDLVIMDDGFQNPALYKDFSLVVVDAGRAIGNGFVHPAGPLRAPLKTQLARADALLLVGTSTATAKVVRVAAKMAKPVIAAMIQVSKPGRWKDAKVYAYCGIGAPNKFYHSLEAVGAQVLETRSFPDHHVYSPTDCEELLQRAEELDALLVTTTKDKARLVRRGDKQTALHTASQALEIQMRLENPKRAGAIIEEVLERARVRRAH
jgi:tetraacyldisaccharide 4'-kinase